MKIVAKYFVGSNSWKIYSKDKKDSSKENTKEMKISFTKSRGNGAMCNCNSKKIYGNIVVPFLIKWGINKKMAKFFLELATLTFPLLKALIWQMLMTTKIVKWSCFSQVLKLHKLITKKFSTNFLKVKVKTICLRPEASKQGLDYFLKYRTAQVIWTLRAFLKFPLALNVKGTRLIDYFSLKYCLKPLDGVRSMPKQIHSVNPTLVKIFKKSLFCLKYSI